MVLNMVHTTKEWRWLVILTSLQCNVGYSTRSPPSRWIGTHLSHPPPCQARWQHRLCRAAGQGSHLRRVLASLPMERETSSVTQLVRDTPQRNGWLKWPPVSGYPWVALPRSPHTAWAGQRDQQLGKPEGLYSHWPQSWHPLHNFWAWASLNHAVFSEFRDHLSLAKMVTFCQVVDRFVDLHNTLCKVNWMESTSWLVCIVLVLQTGSLHFFAGPEDPRSPPAAPSFPASVSTTALALHHPDVRRSHGPSPVIHWRCHTRVQRAATLLQLPKGAGGPELCCQIPETSSKEECVPLRAADSQAT